MVGKAELLPYAKSQCFPRRGKESEWRGWWEHGAHEEEDVKAGMKWEAAGGLAHQCPMMGDGAVGCMQMRLRKSSSPGKVPQRRG